MNTTSTVLVTGNTYPVKDSIKALGGRWDMTAMATECDQVAIAHATAEILDTIRVERETFLGQLDSLTAATLSAVEADAANDTIGRDAHCRTLLDLSYEVLGDCEPVEHLTALLGYVDPEPDL